MQAEEPGAGGVAEDAEGRGSPGDPGSSDGSGGLQDPGTGGSGEAGAEASGAPQVSRALRAHGPGGDALPGPVARRPRARLFQFSFIVAFRSPVLAEMACEYLAPGAQPHPAAVEQDLILLDNILTIQLTAEDPDQLQISISSCLHELCLLIRTMQPILPPFFSLTLGRKRGA